ncbi:MAG: arsenic efflux protein [Butyrivibrio sp.]|nr:arsenic efflux protein [Butyrivibrio sp.]
MDLIIDILLDTIKDGLNVLPFLFVTYYLMELIEHQTEGKTTAFLQRVGRFGPVLGGLFGVIPQCGFSAAASTLYAGRVITLGTLLAIFLSTSDEMVPLLISAQFPVKTMLLILGIKAGIGILAGILVDVILHLIHRLRGKQESPELCVDTLCDREGCHCDGKHVLRSALVHTIHIFSFILLFMLILNAAIAVIGEPRLAAFMSVGGTGFFASLARHLLSGLIGLIPNCAASVVITELYMEGFISMGTMMSGLLVGAGVGLLVLFRTNTDRRENLRITGLLYAIGVCAGLIVDLFIP